MRTGCGSCGVGTRCRVDRSDAQCVDSLRDAELLSISPRVMNYKIKTLGIDYARGRRPMVESMAS